MHIDLRGGQADAFGFIHGLEHGINQLAMARLYRVNGLGHGVQARVGITENGELSHGKNEGGSRYFRHFSP